MALPQNLRDTLSLPLVAAPMFIVSNPDLVIAQCKAGIVGSFPALNARPAAEFVKTANAYRCDILVNKEDLEVNGKSIMGMMMLAAECGSEITIRATGTDADTAVDALVALVERGFGEA